MRLREITSAKKSLYVCRNLCNTDDFIEWIKEQGFPNCLKAEDFHCTIAYSREKVDWDQIEPIKTILRVTGGKRQVKPLGDGGAIVMSFQSKKLEARWKQLTEEFGCSWDFPDYTPHISITYSGEDFDISGMKPFGGTLEFGPEEFSEVEDGGDFEETKLDDDH